MCNRDRVPAAGVQPPAGGSEHPFVIRRKHSEAQRFVFYTRLDKCAGVLTLVPQGAFQKKLASQKSRT